MTIDTLTWNVLSGHMARRIPFMISMGGSRLVTIGYEPASGRLFLRVPCGVNESLPPNRLAWITTRKLIDAQGESVLDVGTESKQFYQEFHRLSSLVTELREDSTLTTVEAFLLATTRWSALLELRPILTPQQQAGLHGELRVLLGLVRARGPASVESWIGRVPGHAARHDFRLGGIDVEVKTTSLLRRVHTIHGFGQLSPSDGHSLYLLSIRIEPAGSAAGATLVESVAAIRSELTVADAARALFEERLAAAGFSDADEEHYDQRVRLADNPRLILVNNDCPRLTVESLAHAMSPVQIARISEVTYCLDCEGMGEEQGSTFYQEVLGPLVVEL